MAACDEFRKHLDDFPSDLIPTAPSIEKDLGLDNSMDTHWWIGDRLFPVERYPIECIVRRTKTGALDGQAILRVPAIEEWALEKCIEVFDALGKKQIQCRVRILQYPGVKYIDEVAREEDENDDFF